MFPSEIISPSIEVPSTILFNLSGELTFPAAIVSLFALNILFILECEDSEFEINAIVRYIKVFVCLFFLAPMSSKDREIGKAIIYRSFF
jgi:hypothetical protein